MPLLLATELWQQLPSLFAVALAASRVYFCFMLSITTSTSGPEQARCQQREVALSVL